MNDERAARFPEHIAAPQLLIQARALASGLYSGVHRSPARGGSSEFEDVRPYVSGESLNRIDWKIAARTDRLFVRQFRREAQQSVMLVVDASASMAFAGLEGESRLRPSKLARARELAAAIAVIIHRQQDRVGLVLSNDRRVIAARAGRAGLHAVIHRLDHARAAGDLALSTALDEIRRQSRLPDLAIVLTDGLDVPETWLEGLARLRRGGGGRRPVDIAVLQVLTNDEIHLPTVGIGRFVDPETGGRVVADSRRMAASYGDRLRQHLDDVHTRLVAMRVRHALHTTASPPLSGLADLFAVGAPALSATR